jgi:hypothetical protein
VTAAVSGREYRPEDDQARQRERPKAKVFTQRTEGAFRTIGQIENEIASDGQRRSRDQRYEVNH